MLGKLARWLRLLGERVFFDKSLGDDEILKKAIKENAVLLTRDELLAGKAGDYARVLLLKPNDSFEQLDFVMKKFGLKPKGGAESSFKICPKCGGSIKRVAKAKVVARVYPRVFKQQKLFWECSGCRQLYWKGSHWKKIRGKISDLKAVRQLSTNSRRGLLAEPGC